MSPNEFTAGRGLNAQDLTRLGAAVAGTYSFPSFAGGAVTADSGLTVNVAAIAGNAVTINGTVVTTAFSATTKTASAADATNPRIDSVYYDSTGAVGIAAGVAVALTATTGPVPPTLAANQIRVADLWLGAGSVTISSADITDRRQSSSGGLTLVANVASATSTTSTSIVDLVTLSGLSIPVTAGIKIAFNYRKQALAANAVGFGLKINSTTLVDPAATAGVAWSSATNRAENGFCEITIGPRSAATYLGGWYSTFATRISADGMDAIAPRFGANNNNAPIPNAVITSVILTAINATASNAAEITSAKVFTF